MGKLLRGIIRGNVIELEVGHGLPDGNAVVAEILGMAPEGLPSAGLILSYGAWADDAEELDRFMEMIRQERKRSRPAIE